MKAMIQSYENRGKSVSTGRWGVNGRVQFDAKGFAEIEVKDEAELQMLRNLKWLIESTVDRSTPAVVAKPTPAPLPAPLPAPQTRWEDTQPAPQVAAKPTPEPVPLPGMPPVTSTASEEAPPPQATPSRKKR